MSFSFILQSTLAAIALAGTAWGAEKSAGVFEGKDTLLRPAAYREWVFVGSSLGLEYEPTPGEKMNQKVEHFNTVYLDPAAYREFSKTGKFPDGTVLILEIASVETKKESGLQGSYQKEFLRLEAAVKDRRRFDKGWAYFSFTEKPGKFKDKAQPFASQTCFDCHQKKAATDNVFTQFYPVLRAIARK